MGRRNIASVRMGSRWKKSFSLCHSKLAGSCLSHDICVPTPGTHMPGAYPSMLINFYANLCCLNGQDTGKNNMVPGPPMQPCCNTHLSTGLFAWPPTYPFALFASVASRNRLAHKAQRGFERVPTSYAVVDGSCIPRPQCATPQPLLKCRQLQGPMEPM